MKVAMTQNTTAHPYEECIKKAGLPMSYDNPNFDDSLYRMKTTSPNPEQVSMYELCKKMEQEKGQGALQSPKKLSTPLLARLFTGGGYYTKNLPLLLLAVVAGYFAYKKFKK